MSGTGWFLLVAWGLTLIGWGYTCWRWSRCIDLLARAEAETAYLRDELVAAHGSTDWEW